jgi:hypothetical protein
VSSYGKSSLSVGWVCAAPIKTAIGVPRQVMSSSFEISRNIADVEFVSSAVQVFQVGRIFAGKKKRFKK